MQKSMSRKLAKEKNMAKQMTNAENMELIVYKIDELKGEVREINRKLDAEYATREWVEAKTEKYEFGNKLVYGLLITFATAIVVAIANFLIRGGFV